MNNKKKSNRKLTLNKQTFPNVREVEVKESLVLKRLVQKIANIEKVIVNNKVKNGSSIYNNNEKQCYRVEVTTKLLSNNSNLSKCKRYRISY